MSWETVKLGSVCDVRDGTHDSPKFIENGFPLITSKNLVNGRIDKANVSYISEDDYKKIAKRSKVDFGDILMPMIGTIGNPVIVEDLNPEFAIKNVALIKFTNKSPDRFFIKLMLQSPFFLTYITKISRGGTQKFLSLGDIRKFAFPLPPINDQIRIATLLSRVEALIATRKDNLRLLDEFLKSMFLEMFGDPVQNEKGFSVNYIEDVTTHIKDGPHVSPKYAEEGIPIFSTRNIRPGKLILDEIKYVSKETYAGLIKYFKPQKGDVLLTKGGTTGYAKAVDFENDFCVWVHLAILRPNDKVMPLYLEYALNSDYCYWQSQKLTKGIANRDLGLKRIARISLLVPPVNLQNQFAAIVEKTESLKTHYQQNLTELENLYGTLSQKAFKGELDLSRVPLQSPAEQEIDLSELVLTVKENVPEDIETTLASLNEFNQNASILKDITRAARAASIDNGHFESIKKAAAQIAAYHSPMEQLKNMSGIASAMGQIESIIKPLNLNQFDAISRSAELACNMASAIPKLDMGWLEQHNRILKNATAPFDAMRSAMERIEALNYSGVSASIGKGAAVSGLIDPQNEAIRKAFGISTPGLSMIDQINKATAYSDPYKYLASDPYKYLAEESWQSRLVYDPFTMASSAGMYFPPPFDYDDVLDVLTNAEEPITLEYLLQQLDEVGTIDFKGYERIKAILFDLLAEQQVTQVFDQEQNLLLFALIKEESPQ